jgi:hypothetical protein
MCIFLVEAGAWLRTDGSIRAANVSFDVRLAVGESKIG